MVAFHFLAAFAFALPFQCVKAIPTVDVQTVEQLNSIPQGWTQGEAPSPKTPMNFRLAVRQEKSAQFGQMVLDLSTPGHSSYGKHMKRSDVKSFMQPEPYISNAIHSWLESEGVPHDSIKDDGDWINFAIPLAQAETMLHTRFHYFHSAFNDKKVIRTLKYSVPRSVSSYVHMIQPTTKFGQPQPRYNTVFESHLAEEPTDQKPDCNITVTPSCLRSLYHMGDNVATQDPRNKLGISGYLEQYGRLEDFNQFKKTFASDLKGTSFEVVTINGAKNEQNSTEDSTEASLDIDYAIGLSNATATYYLTGGRGQLVPDVDQPDPNDVSNEPYLDQLHYFTSLPDEELPAVLSTSYGESEQSVPEKYAESACNLLAQLGARGVSVIFSSGDEGVGSGCQTNDGKNTTWFGATFPAACPFVTSVGGTYHIEPEEAVDFSSGGFSDRYDRPDYQKDVVQKYLGGIGGAFKEYYNANGRAFPDVSAQARNYAVVDKGRVQGVSGTRFVLASQLTIENVP